MEIIGSLITKVAVQRKPLEDVSKNVFAFCEHVILYVSIEKIMDYKNVNINVKYKEVFCKV